MFGYKKRIEVIKDRIKDNITRGYPSASNINIYRNATHWFVTYELDGKVISLEEPRLFITDYTNLSCLETKIMRYLRGI